MARRRSRRPYPICPARPICGHHSLILRRPALDRLDCRRRVRENSRHRPHRLSRRRQDDPAQPHPQRAARQALRRHRQRIRRDRHRQRTRRRRRRGSVRDEQRLHLLHRARRPHPHHRGADEAQGRLRRDHRRDDRPRRSRARSRRPSSSTRTCKRRRGSTRW